MDLRVNVTARMDRMDLGAADTADRRLDLGAADMADRRLDPGAADMADTADRMI